MENKEKYFSGEMLYGDDFDLEAIKKWVKDEEEGYAELGAKNRESYKYVYHSLNSLHGFDHLENRKFNNVLGLGSAYGDEFLPIISRINKLTIIDPSDSLKVKSVHGVPCNYVKPQVDGTLPFAAGTFDLISCLGVLHHIPNVTTVVNELYRCMSFDGVALIREPIISMGDWTKGRPGLTKRERGIPLEILRKIIIDAGFEIKHQTLCNFPLVPKLCNYVGFSAYNSNMATRFDALLARLFAWNLRYHPKKIIHKFRPCSVYVVLFKR